MSILVAIPCFRAGPLIQRCVDSVLAQRHRDLRVVVVGDGEEPELVTSDPRVTVYTLPVNRGTYFARQLMLEASPHAWHAPVDADDWIDRQHLSFLRSRLDGTEAALPRQVRGIVAGRPPKVYGAGRYHVGLMGTERMRSFGGYSPEERIGADTLMIRLLAPDGSGHLRVDRHLQPLPGADQPDHGPGHRHRSQARLEMKERNRAVFRAARSIGEAEGIRAYRRALVPRPLLDELEDHVERLRHALTRTAVAA